MAVTLYMRDEIGPLGSVTVDNGIVTASDSPALAALVRWAEVGGKTAEDLDGWFNGYLLVSTSRDVPWPQEEAVGS